MKCFPLRCRSAAGLIGLTLLASPLRVQCAVHPAAPIDCAELGARAGEQYKGDGLSVVPTPEGARLRCVFQKLEGQVTSEGLWLASTVRPQSGEKFRIVARAIGRAGALTTLPPQGVVTLTDKLARCERSGLTEEYSVSVDGVRQDFIVMQRPDGVGALRVELDVAGARAEALRDGARLVLDGSGRKIAYTRLRVADAAGKALTARLEVMTAARLAVVVEDAAATYPVRIDPTFSDADWFSLDGISGANNFIYAMVVDGSGNLFIGGNFTRAGGNSANYVAKWNGTAWSALGSGVGGVSFPVVTELTVSGTDLYVAGEFATAGGNGATNIAKWNGSSWSALGLGVGGLVSALAASGTDLYVGGLFTNAAGIGANNIAKWNGTNWSVLGTGLNNQVTALAVSGTDLYVGGGFQTAGGISATNIAKWNPTTGWSALGSGVGKGAGFDYVGVLAVSGANLYVGGEFTNAGSIGATRVAKWNGSSWSALGSGVGYFVSTLAVLGTDLYVGGGFRTAGGISITNVAKWNGSSWSALGVGLGKGALLDFDVLSLAVSGSDLYVGGAFALAGGNDANNVAKWNPTTGWSALQLAALNSLVKAVAVSGSDLYVGGTFTTAGLSNANFVAKWNGTAWSPLGSGLNGIVNALAVSGSNLYVGGAFTTAGGGAASRVAKWDGSAWSTLGVGVNNGVANDVYTMTLSGSDLYVGGLFQAAGGFPANRVAKWDGSGWAALGSGLANPVFGMAVSGSDLYVVGGFQTLGSSSTIVNNVAKWNPTTGWSALGTGLNATTYAVVVSGSDVYVGGSFATAGGTNASRVAKWDGSVWSPLGSGVNGNVNALTVVGGDLYAGGDFTLAGGTNASQIAKWNGSEWSPLGLGLNSVVYAQAVSGTDLYVGGNFTKAGGKLAAHVARANIGVTPVFTSIALNPLGTQLLLTFTSDPVASFYLLRSTNLTTWQTNSTVSAAGATNSVSVNLTKPQEFFRLRRLP